MGSPLPIACTLSAGDLGDRLEELRALGRDGLVSSVSTGSEAVLRFRSAPDIRDRVDAIVAAESECCAFMDFTVDHRKGETVVRISAPDGGAKTVQELAAAFSGS